jgi:uncharacterized tellurite resistance protein B-like protein
MDEADRRKICQLVTGVLFSDDDFTDEEAAFLQRVVRRFGFPDDEWQRIEAIEAGAASQALRELPENVRTKVMALLIEATVADGVVDGRERAYLLVAGAALEIDPQVIEQRLRQRLEQLDRLGPLSDPGLSGS